MLGGDALVQVETAAEHKLRGAFFTPPEIAEYLARWAIGRNPEASVLDPTCGDGVFLVSASRELSRLGRNGREITRQVQGVDIHEPTLRRAAEVLGDAGYSASLVRSDFFALGPPGELFDAHVAVDAVIGNPPFVRYQHHVGAARRISAEAALRQGVRLSGLASSWAALLVHASAFLKPSGRLAMVVPAELLTVGYAEPVRQWLRRRFSSVKLVVFERLQFDDALENVVLLLAQGTGGCDAFSIYYVEDAKDLLDIQPFDEAAVALAQTGKWTDLFLSVAVRQTYRETVRTSFVSLAEYGSPELGTVTGANSYFAITEATRAQFGLEPGRQVVEISPPGTRHLDGLSFTRADWERVAKSGEPVWLLHPQPDDYSEGLQRYLAVGETLGVPNAYKCRVRPTWYRPPLVPVPDLFFTYMSHRYPRLVANMARVAILNSMHGIRLRSETPAFVRSALTLLTLNSVTMLGAELHGRSYGGGILKMEPSEAARLPVPDLETLHAAWRELGRDKARLDRQLKDGRWTSVVARVDEVLLGQVLSIGPEPRQLLHEAVQVLRSRRLGRATSRSSDV